MFILKIILYPFFNIKAITYSDQKYRQYRPFWCIIPTEKVLWKHLVRVNFLGFKSTIFRQEIFSFSKIFFSDFPGRHFIINYLISFVDSNLNNIKDSKATNMNDFYFKKIVVNTNVFWNLIQYSILSTTFESSSDKDCGYYFSLRFFIFG